MQPRFLLRAALQLLQLLVPLVPAVLQGSAPIGLESGALDAVVAVWGRSGTNASFVRCTGVFIAPEVVLTAASCLLARAPQGVLEQAACAYGHSLCPTLPPQSLEILAPAALPSRTPVADVDVLAFRFSHPASMPEVCTGGAVCGAGWDIAALRVRQRCAERGVCIRPLAVSGTAAAGTAVRLVGTGRDPSAASLADGFALRYADGWIDLVISGDPLLELSGPFGCDGDAGAPLLRRLPPSLRAEASAQGEGEEVIEWIVVGVHTAIPRDACAPAAPPPHGGPPTPPAPPASMAHDVRMARCWLWWLLRRWGAAPSDDDASHALLVSADTRQWVERSDVREAAATVGAECGASDHWPPERVAPSAALPPEYAALIAEPASRLDQIPDEISPRPSAGLGSAACYASATHLCVHLTSSRGQLRYSVDTGGGSVPSARLALMRHTAYTFQMVGVRASSPLVLSTSPTGPDRRYAGGASGAPELLGAHPAANFSVFVFTPSAETPSHLWYQSVASAGLGGPIHVLHAPLPEPTSLPGGDPALPAAPHALTTWDATGARRHRWEADGEVLGAAGDLSLPQLARDALHAAARAAWRAAYDAAMAFAPPRPNATADNATVDEANASLNQSFNQSLNQSLNQSNGSGAWGAFDSAWDAFAAMLPAEAPPPPPQTVRAVALIAESGAMLWSILWSTAAPDGALSFFRASLRDATGLTAEGVRALPLPEDNATVGRSDMRALAVNSDAGLAVWIDGGLSDGGQIRALDLRSGAAVEWRDPDMEALVRLPPDALDSAAWFDPASALAVDWRDGTLFWCQPSRMRILRAGMRGGGPVHLLVNDTLCSGLAVDALHGHLYWTSSSGHPVWRLDYRGYDRAFADAHPAGSADEAPVYSLGYATPPLDPLGEAVPPGDGARAQLVQLVVSGHNLGGDFGKDPLESPLLLEARADDPDDGDAVFSSLDTITLRFDRPINLSANMLSGSELTKKMTDALFTFSQPIGSSYGGRWLDASTFRIDVRDSWVARPQICANAPAPPPPAPPSGDTNVSACSHGSVTTRAWLLGGAGVLSADGATKAAPMLPFDPTVNRPCGFPGTVCVEGSTGDHSAPALLSARGYDPDNGDGGRVGAGDVLRLQFDRPTYAGQKGFERRTVLGKAQVDELVSFVWWEGSANFSAASARVPIPGLDYEGRWLDSSTFEVLVTVGSYSAQFREGDVTFVAIKNPIEMQTVTPLGQQLTDDAVFVSVVGDLRSLGRRSAACRDSVLIGGDWGERTVSPQVKRVYGTDPDNGDSVPSAGDVLTVVFDRATSRGIGPRGDSGAPPSGTREHVDYFFLFDPPIGLPIGLRPPPPPPPPGGVGLGDAYVGAWLDDSTFRIEIRVPNPGWLKDVQDGRRTHLLAEGARDECVAVPCVKVSERASVCNSARVSQSCDDDVGREVRLQHLRSVTGFGAILASQFGVGLSDDFLFGFPGPPVLTRAVAFDLDNLATEWSEGDAIRLSFDRATLQGRQGVLGGREYVDSLFGFSHNLGLDYSGAWLDASSFTVTVLNATLSLPRINRTTVEASSSLSNAAGTARDNPSRRVAVLTGDFGQPVKPLFVGFEAEDARQAAPGLSAGDVLRFR